MKTEAQIKRRRSELRRRANLCLPLAAPIRRAKPIRQEEARHIAQLAASFAANLLDWVLGE